MKTFTKFLKELEKNLYFFSEEEIKQILMDYQELYNDKITSGLSEEDVIKSFDAPKQIAINYSQELNIKTSFFKKITIKLKKKTKVLSKGLHNKVNKLRRNLVEVIQKKTKKDKQKQFFNGKIAQKISISYIIYNIWKLIKLLKKLLVYSIKLMIKITKWIIILCLVLSIIGIIILYILSFIFLRLNVNTLILRTLESLITFSYITCTIICISFLFGANRE
ncbi:MAG: HAAS signaling domain-containing protein [Mycoplasmatales bacterium]